MTGDFDSISTFDDSAMTRSEVASRRKFVKAALDSLRPRSPGRKVGPIEIYRYAMNQAEPRPTWFREDERKMRDLFKDDIYWLGHPEKRHPSIAPRRRHSSTAKDSVEDLARLAAHSSELAEKVFRHPGALLNGPLLGDSADSEQVGYGREHLKAYPDILAAGVHLLRADVERDRLAGKPHPMELLYTGDTLIEGEAGNLLLKKVRGVVNAIYPGLPEWLGVGALPQECTLPKEIAGEVWMQVGASEGDGAPLDFHVVLEPFEGRWRVARPSSTAYVIVASEKSGKPAELERALGNLTGDVELCRMYTAVRDSTLLASEAREGYLSKVRRLGTQLGHGALIEGTCSLGY